MCWSASKFHADFSCFGGTVSSCPCHNIRKSTQVEPLTRDQENGWPGCLCFASLLPFRNQLPPSLAQVIYFSCRFGITKCQMLLLLFVVRCYCYLYVVQYSSLDEYWRIFSEIFAFFLLFLVVVKGYKSTGRQIIYI